MNTKMKQNGDILAQDYNTGPYLTKSSGSVHYSGEVMVRLMKASRCKGQTR